jgi:rhamnosyltransferase
MPNAALERIAVVIPTLNAGRRWADCLAAICAQSLKPERRLVIDSASTDDTAAAARSAGFEVREISRADFNHGGTRQWAAEYLGDCEIIVFLTQDAILASTEALAELTRCLADRTVAVAYGRQLPHRGATPIEAHARLFNYADSTQKKDLGQRRSSGAKAFFCSNSFAAYRRATLLQLSGFRRDLILGEDMEFAARALLAGYANVYCAEATVYHSHDYSMREMFRRYFDLGVFEARNQWMRQHFGSHKSEGLRFVKAELRYLLANAPLQIPRSILHTCAKFCGYRLGMREQTLPKSVKRRLSMSRAYWA